MIKTYKGNWIPNSTISVALPSELAAILSRMTMASALLTSGFVVASLYNLKLWSKFRACCHEIAHPSYDSSWMSSGVQTKAFRTKGFLSLK